METIVNNCNKPHNTGQGQEWVGTRPAQPGWQRAENRRWRDVGSGERAGIPIYTSRIRLPCLWKKVDFGSRLRGRGRPHGRPRGFWGLTPADPGTCTTAAPEGRTSPCPERSVPRVSAAAALQRHDRTGRKGQRRCPGAGPDGAVGGGRAAAGCGGCAGCRSCRPAAEPRFVPGGGAERGVRGAFPSRLSPSRVSPNTRVPRCLRPRAGCWVFGVFFPFSSPPFPSPPPRPACSRFYFWLPVRVLLLPSEILY